MSLPHSTMCVTQVQAQLFGKQCKFLWCIFAQHIFPAELKEGVIDWYLASLVFTQVEQATLECIHGGVDFAGDLL